MPGEETLPASLGPAFSGPASSGSIRQDDLRPRNRGTVISALRHHGVLSRTELVGRTKLSHSTISAIASGLIDEGILRQSGASEATSGRRGRPQVALELNPQAGVVVTALLSLNRISAALVDYSGAVLTETATRLPTATLDAKGLIEALQQTIATLLAQSPWPAAPLLRVVLAVQGVTDANAQTLLWSPITASGDIPLAAILEERFNAPAAVENDCNMIAFALRWRDRTRYPNNFLAVLLSHGIGMGLMLRGDVFHGMRSSAGEFGHMNHIPDGALCRCGRRGCIEAYGGNYGIWRRAKGLSPDEMPDDTIDDAAMAALITAARQSDGPERTAFKEAGTAIGYGLGSLFALIDPAPVAIVGMGATAFDLLEPSIRHAIAQTAGGQHSDGISFAVEGDEMSLIHQGCAMRALTTVDTDLVATGSSMATLHKQAVA